MGTGRLLGSSKGRNRRWCVDSTKRRGGFRVRRGLRAAPVVAVVVGGVVGGCSSGRGTVINGVVPVHGVVAVTTTTLAPVHGVVPVTTTTLAPVHGVVPMSTTTSTPVVGSSPVSSGSAGAT